LLFGIFEMGSVHKPVLLKESIELLEIKSGVYVDCTLGGGGHAMAASERLKAKGGKIIGLDVDSDAIERFQKYLIAQKWEKKRNVFRKNKVEIILVNENFEKLSEVLKKLGISEVNGIIADLGVSSDQLEESERGFSYSKDSTLDMRMDKRLGVTAADLVNGLFEKELVRIFQSQDEVFARRIAGAIVRERERKPIRTTLHLVQIIKKALPFVKKGKGYKSSKTNVRSYWVKPVMRVFQALRNQVNSELSSLQNMLPQAFEALATGSSLVIISFHSGEDRIVKTFFRKCKDEGKCEILTKRPIESSEEEVERNVRARSAKLRGIRKIGSEVEL
jgi:16S rRNA (cytosine1402-N4)-methyltransferase